MQLEKKYSEEVDLSWQLFDEARKRHDARVDSLTENLLLQLESIKRRRALKESD